MAWQGQEAVTPGTGKPRGGHESRRQSRESDQIGQMQRHQQHHHQRRKPQTILQKYGLATAKTDLELG